jgi:hypothetical protein
MNYTLRNAAHIGYGYRYGQAHNADDGADEHTGSAFLSTNETEV